MTNNDFHYYLSITPQIYCQQLQIGMQRNVHPISDLKNFVNSYPDENLHDSLAMIEDCFPRHRVIRGDGNCFYRAFAFWYLVLSPCASFELTFPKVQFNYNKPDSIVDSDAVFQRQLLNMWQKYLRPLTAIKTRDEKQKKLQTLFNQMKLFDELMVGYFRSTVYQHLANHTAKFREFLGDEYDIILQRVPNFGAESQGTEITCLAEALKVKVIVLCVGYDGFQPITYMQHLQSQQFYLFYRPGHYDIVYPDPNYGSNLKLKNGGTLYSTIKNRISSNLWKSNTKQTPDTPTTVGNTSTTPAWTHSTPAPPKPKPMTPVQPVFSPVSTHGQAENGKFDIRYSSKGGKTGPSASQSSLVKKSKTTVISTYEDPFRKLSLELAAVAILVGLVYSVYSYF